MRAPTPTNICFAFGPLLEGGSIVTNSLDFFEFVENPLVLIWSWIKVAVATIVRKNDDILIN